MEGFLKTITNGDKFELLIDTKIFDKDLILKSAYNFLDKGYFYFRFDNDNNIILQFTTKQGVEISPEKIIGDFSDNLLDTYLRDKLEKDNKVIRETIVEKAINGPIDSTHFVSLDTDNIQDLEYKSEENQINFDKDIEDILKDIESDPDLQINEEEIEKILREIEEESAEEKVSITIDIEAVKKAKQNFKN